MIQQHIAVVMATIALIDGFNWSVTEVAMCL